MAKLLQWLRGRGGIAVGVLALLVLPLAYSVVSHLVARATVAPAGLLERPDPEHERCLEDTAYMRFHHWELLRRVREEVVRYGARGEVGLKRCMECHKSRERFCDRCHESVSLSPDCFGCHHYP